jgi:hypothetical protein
MAHYPLPARRLVVYQRFTLHKTPQEISVDLDIRSVRTVQRILARWLTEGVVTSRRLLRPGPRCAIKPEYFSVCRSQADHLRSARADPAMSVLPLQILADIVDGDPSLYLDEIQWELRVHTGVQFQISVEEGDG